MLRLPEKNSLDFRIKEILKEKCEIIVEVPTKDEEKIAFPCESLQSLNNATLILGIEQERTEAGRGMVRGLWHDKVVVVWISSKLETLRIVTFPYRCHIVGSVFSKIYNEIKRDNPEAEVSIVWELIADKCEVTNAFLPEPVLQIQEGEFEYHLDHPSIIK